MNDSLSALLSTPVSPPGGPVGNGPPGKARNGAPPSASFADIVGAATQQQRQSDVETKELPESHGAGKKDLTRETPEELAAMAVMTQQRIADTSDTGPAQDAAETPAVSTDMEVNALSASPAMNEQPSNLTNLLLMLIRQGDGGDLSDTLEQFLTTQGTQAALPGDIPGDLPDLAEALALRLNEAIAGLEQPVPGVQTDEEGMGALMEVLQTAQAVATDGEAAPLLMDMCARLAALARTLKEEGRAHMTDPVPEALTDTQEQLPAVGRPIMAYNLVEGRADRTEDDPFEDPPGAFRVEERRAAGFEKRAEGRGDIPPLQSAGAQRAAGVTADQPVEPAQVIRQVVQSAVLAQSRNVSQIRLQLNPEFLGRVEIILTAAAGGMTARIHAQNDTVRGMLAAHVGALQSDLKELGINMKSIDITRSEQDWQMARDGAGRQDTGREQPRGENGGQDNTDSPITMARFHAARRPAASGYDLSGIPADDDGGVDFRA